MRRERRTGQQKEKLMSNQDSCAAQGLNPKRRLRATSTAPPFTSRLGLVLTDLTTYLLRYVEAAVREAAAAEGGGRQFLLCAGGGIAFLQMTRLVVCEYAPLLQWKETYDILQGMLELVLHASAVLTAQAVAVIQGLIQSTTFDLTATAQHMFNVFTTLLLRCDTQYRPDRVTCNEVVVALLSAFFSVCVRWPLLLRDELLDRPTLWTALQTLLQHKWRHLGFQQSQHNLVQLFRLILSLLLPQNTATAMTEFACHMNSNVITDAEEYVSGNLAGSNCDSSIGGGSANGDSSGVCFVWFINFFVRHLPDLTSKAEASLHSQQEEPVRASADLLTERTIISTFWRFRSTSLNGSLCTWQTHYTHTVDIIPQTQHISTKCLFFTAQLPVLCTLPIIAAPALLTSSLSWLSWPHSLVFCRRLMDKMDKKEGEDTAREARL
eukprot:GHVS01085544.1.p1 GENE.GHVS01085544.1~~GHVS01085544.1.p1  ORF type:complete len:437 (-),score=62.03 GHVS01085544.1:380-1690(-)